jgi:hypothetical protein
MSLMSDNKFFVKPPPADDSAPGKLPAPMPPLRVTGRQINAATWVTKITGLVPNIGRDADRPDADADDLLLTFVRNDSQVVVIERRSGPWCIGTRATSAISGGSP